MFELSETIEESRLRSPHQKIPHSPKNGQSHGRTTGQDGQCKCMSHGRNDIGNIRGSLGSSRLGQKRSMPG